MRLILPAASFVFGALAAGMTQIEIQPGLSRLIECRAAVGGNIGVQTSIGPTMPGNTSPDAPFDL